MPINATHTRCPYTLKPLGDLPKVNDEHIFPDAIGGVKDYSVRVDEAANSQLGTRIDAPLVDSFLIGALRLQHGIKSRKGRLEWKLRGAAKDSGRQVEVVFPEQGNVEVSVRKPVEMSDAGDSGTLILSPGNRDSFLRTFVENHKKKGRTVVTNAESRLRIEEIEVPIQVDLLALKRAMTKIAFVAAYEYLGDAFLDDPLIPEWHKAFMADDPEIARTARIHGSAFDTPDLLEVLFPSLEPYEHAVAIANLQMAGPVVAVTLFGKSFHSLVVIASETTTYGLDVAEGRIMVCDAKAAKTRCISFVDHLVSKADELPWASLPDIPGAGRQA